MKSMKGVTKIRSEDFPLLKILLLNLLISVLYMQISTNNYHKQEDSRAKPRSSTLCAISLTFLANVIFSFSYFSIR